MQLTDLQAKIGEIIGTSDWFTMDQGRINNFADSTEDHQFIHVDPEAAKATPFGGTIAHGFLTQSMLAVMMNSSVEKPVVKMSVNYGFDKPEKWLKSGAQPARSACTRVATSGVCC